MSKIVEELKPVIENIIEDKLIELLGDPDQGLELRPEVKKRLKQVLLSKNCVPVIKVAEKLGLQW